VTPCMPLSIRNFESTESATSAPAYQHGELSGQVQRLRTIGPFTISETSYPAGMVMTHHNHAESHITFVIEGTFRERYAAGSLVCRAGSVRFLPEAVVHETEIESPLRCLHVISESKVLDQLARKSVVPQKPMQIHGFSATWLANRLYAEFSRGDEASAMAIEGLVLEILAEMSRSDSSVDSLPRPNWLRHATEIVEARFLERLSLAEIASEVGVHYVHLSRQFHKYNRCTVGELIRRRRVQHASHLLAHTETPLAEIALICGFSDQSHLSFLFKRYMGLSPSKFRLLAGREAARQPRQEAPTDSLSRPLGFNAAGK
jgi:AraC family transcriptional regulator